MSRLVLAEDLATFTGRLGVAEAPVAGHATGAAVASVAEALRGPPASRMALIESMFLPPGFYGMDLTTEQHPPASKSLRRRSAWSGEVEAREYLGAKPPASETRSSPSPGAAVGRARAPGRETCALPAHRHTGPAHASDGDTAVPGTGALTPGREGSSRRSRKRAASAFSP